MPVFRWGQPWDPLHNLERQVDRLLQGVSMTLHGVRFGRSFPQVNLHETADSYVLMAEIPGSDVSQLPHNQRNSPATGRSSRRRFSAAGTIPRAVAEKNSAS